MQGGVDVSGDSWSSLQYSYDARRKLALVSLVAEGEDGADHATLTFQTSCADRICPALLHGGAGAVGNYRADHDRGLNWLLDDPSSRPLAFREFFVQSSHNTFILGQQLKLALRGNPIDIVYAEAFPIALNLGYRCLELDIFRAHEKAGGELLVRHGPIGAPSNSVTLSDVLAAIVDWMARDERGAVARLRLPLVLSVENNLSSEAAEVDMAASFGAAFGARVVLPAAFHDPTMRALACGRRRVILKGGSYLGRELGAVPWAELVAMWKSPIHPLDCEATVCKSIEAPSASALANPSRLIAQSSHFLTTTANKSRRASVSLGRSLTRTLTGLLELSGDDASTQDKQLRSVRRAATSNAILTTSSPSGGSFNFGRAALWRLPAPGPAVAASAVEGTQLHGGEATPAALKVLSVLDLGAVQKAVRELKAAVAIQARFRGRMAREDRRLETLSTLQIHSGHSDTALALELQLRVINARRKTNELRAEARHAIDPTLRIDRILCKVYPRPRPNSFCNQCTNAIVVVECGHQCANMPMRQCTNICTNVPCANAPMCQCTNVPMHQCANAPMPIPDVPINSPHRQVYPPKTYQLSQNFDPIGGFDARAHFICMNMQGKAASGRAKLTADVGRGLAAPPSTKCLRDRARSVEKIFLRDGYDGYMRMDAWCVSLRNDFERFLAAEVKDESLPLRLWHRLVGRGEKRAPGSRTREPAPFVRIGIEV